MRQSVTHMKGGDLFQCIPLHLSYLNNTVEVFPYGDEKELINVTFISVCKNENCKKCVQSKKRNYTFFETVEYGHLMTLTQWEYDKITFVKDPA